MIFVTLKSSVHGYLRKHADKISLNKSTMRENLNLFGSRYNKVIYCTINLFQQIVVKMSSFINSEYHFVKPFNNIICSNLFKWNKDININISNPYDNMHTMFRL